MGNLPLYIGITLAILSGFFEPIIRYGKEAKSLKTDSYDKNSTKFLGFLSLINILLLFSGIWMNNNHYMVMFANYPIAYLGIVVMICGSFIRIISIRTLKNYYTRTLRIQPNQMIIESGFYKSIRHPGYLGSIVRWSGVAFASNNYIILLSIIVLTILIYYYRIRNGRKNVDGIIWR